MIAGIDYSTRAIDVVLLDEDTDRATWHRAELQGKDSFDRSRDVPRAMHDLPLDFWEDVLAVGIEDPRGYGAGALYRVQGAILSRLPLLILVEPLIPSHWRKTVGLAGNASKPTIHDFARHRMYIATGTNHIWPQDAMDAFCIALATRTLLARQDAA